MFAEWKAEQEAKKKEKQNTSSAEQIQQAASV